MIEKWASEGNRLGHSNGSKSKFASRINFHFKTRLNKLNHHIFASWASPLICYRFYLNLFRVCLFFNSIFLFKIEFREIKIIFKSKIRKNWKTERESLNNFLHLSWKLKSIQGSCLSFYEIYIDSFFFWVSIFFHVWNCIATQTYSTHKYDSFDISWS